MFLSIFSKDENSTRLLRLVVVLVCAARRERNAVSQKDKSRTTEEKTAGAALVRGVSGPKPRFRIEGVRGWIFWTRCGMGL